MSVSLSRLLAKEVLSCTAIGLTIGVAGSFLISQDRNTKLQAQNNQLQSQLAQINARNPILQDSYTRAR